MSSAPQDDQVSLTFMQRLGAATFGAAAAATATNPFDVVKTRLQSGAQGSRSVVQVAVSIVAREGFPALYRGLRPTLFMALPSTGIYLTAYEYGRDYLSPSPYAALVAGAVSRTMSACLVAPLEVVRTNLQAGSGASGELGEMVGIVRRLTSGGRGVLGMWTGIGPTLVRDVPFSAIYWGLYESGKQFAVESQPALASSKIGLPFLLGAASGSVAAVVTHPMDVVKTRVQVGSDGMAVVLRNISQAPEGPLRVLFKGLTPRVARVTPACAIVISAFEFAKNLVGKRRDDDDA